MDQISALIDIGIVLVVGGVIAIIVAVRSFGKTGGF